jgi:hypothetical protein
VRKESPDPLLQRQAGILPRSSGTMCYEVLA